MKKYLITILTSSDLEILKLSVWAALNQINKDYHIYVIVNSLDKSYFNKVEELCNKSYPGKIEKIVETESNGKPGKGHNSLLDIFIKTSYEYLVICDGDDFLYPTALSRLDKLMQDNKYDAITLLGNPSHIKISKSKYKKSIDGNKKKYKWNREIIFEKNSLISTLSPKYNTNLATPVDFY
jgi:cellulose synthase/poly-beta-1,6-N-acetylglucosamine synthase-like glycosyltransferase